ncbi:MAG TPA: hypothetical protein VFP60_19525 [Pseudolabrys sp.]|nr:hypothetical protein [Pseudolabrys sp.]
MAWGSHTMATRSSSRRWFLRDIPRTYVLIVWLAFGAVLLIYANDWHPSGWSALRREAAAPARETPRVESYTGSIIIMPPRGDACRQMMLDNRTGAMWDNGYVSCDEVVSRPERDARGMSTMRMNAIGNAFRRRDE